jgi:uncharacterized protein YuzB (UPF0349 family)
MDVVYLITDTITGLKYLGSKKNYLGENTYFGSPNCKNVENKKYILQQNWKSCVIERPDTFTFEILESFDIIEHKLLIECELSWQQKFNVVKSIEFINAGYARKGFCGNIYENISKEEKLRIINKRSSTIRFKNSLLSKEEKLLKYSKSGDKNGMYGYKWSEEQKKNISNKLIEKYKHEVSPHKGLKRSKETKEKLSIIASLRVGKKNSFYGRKHSQESRNKMTEKLKGKIPPNRKPLEIDGIKYDCMKFAIGATGISYHLITQRIKSTDPIYDSYKYI